MKFSVIIPVYQNEGSIPELLQALNELSISLRGEMEAVFVVDGSPDKCFELLSQSLEGLDFPAQLIAHSRNFGSFPAIRTGLATARGRLFAVMAADLQEPPELILEFFNVLDADQCDVAVGVRNTRNDPSGSKLASKLFWGLYRRLVVKEIPEGGVDVFACNEAFRAALLNLSESRSSLIALLFWLGFRRSEVIYDRRKRSEGKSAWTLRKKIEYMSDSIFAFTDLPIKILLRIGLISSIFMFLLAGVILLARAVGAIEVPGYAATMLVILTLGFLNLFGLGLVGTYAWRAYENSKQRPLAIVALKTTNQKVSGSARQPSP